MENLETVMSSTAYINTPIVQSLGITKWKGSVSTRLIKIKNPTLCNFSEESFMKGILWENKFFYYRAICKELEEFYVTFT